MIKLFPDVLEVGIKAPTCNGVGVDHCEGNVAGDELGKLVFGKLRFIPALRNVYASGVVDSVEIGIAGRVEISACAEEEFALAGNFHREFYRRGGIIGEFNRSEVFVFAVISAVGNELYEEGVVAGGTHKDVYGSVVKFVADRKASVGKRDAVELNVLFEVLEVGQRPISEEVTS